MPAQPMPRSPDSSSLSQIVLLSGGLDSVVNFSMAVDKGEVVLGLTFDYGQRSRGREIEAASRVCAHYSVPHRVISLPWMQELGGSALLQGQGEVPRLAEEDLSSTARTKESARAVWVPNRNGVFIEIAAALAESMGACVIVTGFNREEAETFPDNSGPFLEAVNLSLQYSTQNRVWAVSYTVTMDKKEIVEAGLRYRAPFEFVWSCYLGGEKMCGECESCRRMKRAIAGTELSDRMRNRFRI